MSVAIKQRGSLVMLGDLQQTGVLRITHSTYLFSLTTSSGAVVSTAAGRGAGGTIKKISIMIDGVAYSLLAAATWT